MKCWYLYCVVSMSIPSGAVDTRGQGWHEDHACWRGKVAPPPWQKAMELSLRPGLSPLPCTLLGAPFKGESYCSVLQMGKWRWQQKFRLGGDLLTFSAPAWPKKSTVGLGGRKQREGIRSSGPSQERCPLVLISLCIVLSLALSHYLCAYIIHSLKDED